MSKKEIFHTFVNFLALAIVSGFFGYCLSSLYSNYFDAKQYKMDLHTCQTVLAIYEKNQT